MILIAVLGIGGVGALVALRGQIFGSATSAEPDPPSAAEDPRRAPPPPALPDKVTIDLPGLPPGAQVFVDGDATGAALPLRLARDDRRHQRLVRAPGRQPRAIEIDGTRDRVVELELAPVPADNPDSARAAETAGPPHACARSSARGRSARTRRPQARRRLRQRGLAGPSGTTSTPLGPAETSPSPKPPPKPAHSSYDEM